MKSFWFVFLLFISILSGVNIAFADNVTNRISDMTNPFLYQENFQATSQDDIINFLATADIHAGYPNSNSSIVINCIEDKLHYFQNRGVVIAGDLTGDIKNSDDVVSYKNMIAPIKNKVLAGFGNHDIGKSSSNQATLLKYVKENAQATVVLRYFNSDGDVPVYSWDWSGIHFVQLSLAPTDIDTTKEQNNFPSLALTKLKEDLYSNVGLGTNTPVVLIHHYGYDNFSRHVKRPWWNVQQINDFKKIIKHFNVILIVSGHKHNKKPEDMSIYQVGIEGRRIINIVVGAALKNKYGQFSIDKKREIIRFQSFDAVDNDKVVYNGVFRFPNKPRNVKFYEIINTYHQEYLYAADYAPFDRDRRRVFTWREKNTVLDKTIWEIIWLSHSHDLALIYNVYQGEYLYASESDLFDRDRRRVFTWIPATVANGTTVDRRFFWKIEKLANDEISIFNVYHQEYLYAADYAPFDRDRRRIFTWIPGNDVAQNIWRLEQFDYLAIQDALYSFK